MRNAWIIVLALLTLALPADAQRGQRGGRGEDGWGQRGQGRQMRAGRGPMGHPGGMPMGMLLHRLPDQLELDDDQLALFDQIADKYQQGYDERSELRGQRRELSRQYHDARQQGDYELASDIRTQMDAIGAERETEVKEFFTEVRTILDEEQIQKLDQFQERMQSRMQAGRQQASAMRLMRDLPEQLDFTDEQQAVFDELVAERRERGRQHRELRREMREARRSGDEARLAELEAELEEQPSGMRGPDALLAEIENILTDEQKAKLDELRSGAVPTTYGGPAVRDILRAAKKVEMNAEQRDQLKEITRVAMKAGRKSADRASAGELAQSVKKQIVELLDSEQTAQFERELKQLEERGRRGEERGRRQGGGRGGRGPR